MMDRIYITLFFSLAKLLGKINPEAVKDIGIPNWKLYTTRSGEKYVINTKTKKIMPFPK